MGVRFAKAGELWPGGVALSSEAMERKPPVQVSRADPTDYNARDPNGG
jgi:hypothetical protein